MIEAGELGAVRVVQVEFALGWLSGRSDREQVRYGARTLHKPAPPSSSAISAPIASTSVSSLLAGAAALAADLQTMVPGRRLEDNAHILLRYDNGACGAMWVSAVAAGEHVGLRLRVYGEKGTSPGSRATPTS